jgi:hypothetical protein
MSRTTALVDQIAEIRRLVDAIPAGAERAKIEARFVRATTDVARKISAAAKAKAKEKRR